MELVVLSPYPIDRPFIVVTCTIFGFAIYYPYPNTIVIAIALPFVKYLLLDPSAKSSVVLLAITSLLLIPSTSNVLSSPNTEPVKTPSSARSAVYVISPEVLLYCR